MIYALSYITVVYPPLYIAGGLSVSSAFSPYSFALMFVSKKVVFGNTDDFLFSMHVFSLYGSLLAQIRTVCGQCRKMKLVRTLFGLYVQTSVLSLRKLYCFIHVP